MRTFPPPLDGEKALGRETLADGPDQVNESASDIPAGYD